MILTLLIWTILGGASLPDEFAEQEDSKQDCEELSQYSGLSFVPVQVGGLKMAALVDTGSDSCLIDLSVYNQLVGLQKEQWRPVVGNSAFVKGLSLVSGNIEFAIQGSNCSLWRLLHVIFPNGWGLLWKTVAL
ncbi:MAG: aspartyl protease family protein [Planctomycetaceae bacterium]